MIESLHIKEYTKELLADWIKHKQIIICVDYDDTLMPWKGYNYETCKKTAQLIRESKNLGAEIILWTCRTGKQLKEAKSWCKANNIPLDKANPSKPWKDWLSIKPYCNIMLDDKCGLEQAQIILEGAIKQYKEYLNGTS